MFEARKRWPTDWPTQSLEKIASQITSGGTPTSGSPRYYVEYGGLPFAKTEDLSRTDSRFIEECELEISEAALKETAAKMYPTGTLLISMYGTIGLTKITAIKMAANQALCALIPPLSCDSGYLYHHLQYIRPEWMKYSGQTTQANINGATVRAHAVPLPEPIEQRKIAQVLDTLDTAIHETEAIIAKLKAIKQGLLHDLLTRGIDANGELRPPQAEAPHLYKQSPLGWIPKEWNVKSLSEFTSSEITYGIVQAGPHVPNGVPYIRTGDMFHDCLIRETMLCTSRRIASNYARSEVRTGDIVMAIRATVGKVLPVSNELDGANLTQGTAKISSNKCTDEIFLLWALRHFRVQQAMQREVKGTTFSEITLGALRQIPVAAPLKINEQQEIGNRLTVMDKQLQNEREYLAKAFAEKMGIMDDLLTGRVRVTPLLEPAP